MQIDTDTDSVSHERVTRSKMKKDAEISRRPAKFNFDALVTPEKNRDALGRNAMNVDSSPTFRTKVGAAEKRKAANIAKKDDNMDVDTS